MTETEQRRRCRSCNQEAPQSAFGFDNRRRPRGTCASCRGIASGESVGAYLCSTCGWSCRTKGGLSQHASQKHLVRNKCGKNGMPLLSPAQKARIGALQGRLNRGDRMDSAGAWKFLVDALRGVA